MPSLRPILVLVCAALLIGCGGEASRIGSPTAPTPFTPPATPPVSVFNGAVTETLTGAPVLAFTAAITGSRLTVLAPGYITRETALGGGNVDLIREADFDLGFYRQFVRNALEATGNLEPLRRQVTAPRIYLRTVDNAGAPISSAQLDSAQRAILDVAGYFNGGLGIAALERGSETREGQSGWITVTWLAERADNFCGRAYVGGGLIELNYKYGDGCSCGELTVRPRTVKHEIGHAMGFWHTDHDNDVMYGKGVWQCDNNPSVRERHHAAIAYARPLGSRDMDVDPSFSVSRIQPVLVID